MFYQQVHLPDSLYEGNIDIVKTKKSLPDSVIHAKPNSVIQSNVISESFDNDQGYATLTPSHNQQFDNAASAVGQFGVNTSEVTQFGVNSSAVTQFGINSSEVTQEPTSSFI